MKNKKLPILIYPGYIIIYHGTKNELEKKYKKITGKEKFGNCCARTVTMIDESNIYLFLKKDINIDVIVHECIHIKDFLDEKYELRMHIGGEPECYLVQYLFKNIISELGIKVTFNK